MDSEGTVSQEQVVDATPKLVIDQAYIEKRNLSYSSLKAFRKSPKHFVLYQLKPPVTTDAMLLGKVVDCLALTPELFDKNFMVANKPPQYSAAAKADWAKILDLAGRNRQLVVTPEQVKTAKFCVESLLSTDESFKLLSAKTKTQVHLQWREQATNLPIHGYVDFESKAWEEDFVVDLKTTKDADPDEFNKSVFNEDYQYYLQAGTYLVGYHKAKYRFPYFVDLAVETSEPYNVSVNFFDNKVTDLAKDEFYGTCRAFRYCLDKNLFHQGYEFRLAESMNYFSVKTPSWWKPRYSGFEGSE